MRREIIRTVEAVMILLILAIGFYPAISDAWNQCVAARMITQYQEKMERQTIESDMETEDEEISVDENGMMGYLEIPCISVTLPIYEGTTDEILEKGVGHAAGSSLPIGGEGTHTVLTGHRGLPSAKLFTDLDQLEEGDRFMIHSSGRELVYEVTDIRTVLPYETESLSPVKGKDLATLVTCTPYGVNTHRLLVTGTRVNGLEKSGYTDWSPWSWLENRQEKFLQLLKPVAILVTAASVAVIGVIRILWIWLLDWPRQCRRETRRYRREQHNYGKLL